MLVCYDYFELAEKTFKFLVCLCTSFYLNPFGYYKKPNCLNFFL